MEKNKNRIYFLDAFRGIAAVTVVLSHLSLVFLSDSIFKNLFEALGRSAVILFFLLSGIVLSGAVTNMSLDIKSYLKFIFIRFKRIYVPFIFIIIISEFIYFNISPSGISGLGNWFNAVGTQYNNIDTIIDNILMTGNNVSAIDPVIWSLIIELRLSFIFPFVYFFVKKYGIKYSLLLSLFCFFLGSFCLYSIGQSFLIGQTIFHLSFFIFGILIHFNYSGFFNLNTSVKLLCLFVSLILYCNVFILSLFSITLPQVISDIFVSFGCVICIVIFFSSKKLQYKISNKLFLWLGKISFSLYLVHCIVFVSFIYFFKNYNIEIVYSLFISIPMIFIIAYIYFITVERPSRTFKFSNLKYS